jgi:pimeloyl-ACP methyl ester carboxylesterase
MGNGQLSDQQVEIEMLWCERGGAGPRTVLLLHGLGATAAVWRDVRQVIEQRGVARWIAPDFSGHGLSESRSAYSIGQLAADTAPLVRDVDDLFIVGHSLGVYVGLALASRWFGVRVTGVLGVGPKVTWSEADLQGARDLAARPVRWYRDETEALARYRRVSGLDESIAPDRQWLERGVAHGDEGFRLAQDPRTFSVGGAPFATLVASADSRILLARGERDSMVSLAELRAHHADARDIAGAGHNVHVEDAQAIVALLEEFIAIT